MNTFSRLLLMLALLAAGCTGSDADASVSADEWSEQAKEAALTELSSYCSTVFSDDSEESAGCDVLAVAAMDAAEEIGRCTPAETVNAVKGGIPATTEEGRDEFLRCASE